MKKILLFSFLLLTLGSYAQSITRGPGIGEVYFLGPTHTNHGLYYSTDFGETAICVDSINDFGSIAADKTSGCIYYFDSPENLYYSGNYGNANSWVFRNSGITDNIKSGVNEGFIFSGCVLHSEDYGVNFSFHSLNGFFGNPKNIAIDNVDDNIGYVLVFKISVPDTLYLFKTLNKFEDVNIVQKLNFPNGQFFHLSRGFDGGEVYLYYRSSNSLNFSLDYAESFNSIDNFNFSNYYSFDVIGGKQDGEVFILYSFVNQMWLNVNIYIYHSTNYGKSFEVYHPFSKGNEPVLANFSSIIKEVHLATPVPFSNFSIGDIQEYQWDFENDGTIDSYEETPTHFYQDTGWYSVKLSVVGLDSTNTFIKEDYIHVIDTTTFVCEIEKQSGEIKVFPNPFSSHLTILFKEANKTSNNVEIINNQGKRINQIFSDNKVITWNGVDNKGQKCSPGIYYIKKSNRVHKVILTK